MQGGETVIEDWEIWGDPREIERRKADRKRANLPLEQRRVQLAEEWLQSKAEAATAKAAANKPRQKVAGLVIRDLKLEMKQLGTHTRSNSANILPPWRCRPSLLLQVCVANNLHYPPPYCDAVFEVQRTILSM